MQQQTTVDFAANSALNNEAWKLAKAALPATASFSQVAQRAVVILKELKEAK